MKRVELVLPAGDFIRAKIALLYGADSIYLGLDKYSLRKAEVRFSLSEIKKAIDYAHSLKKKVYLTFNIFTHNNQLEAIESDLKKVAKLKPDALIISDPGVISVAKRVAGEIPIHLSTQANTLNIESVRFWQAQGIKRIVLARELNLEEITAIHQAVPEMELEIFAHGAMCVAYSGRCLLSNYLTGREANLGDCAQPCRWNYKLIQNSKFKIQKNPKAREALQDSLISSQDDYDYFLEEKLRPGEYLPISEDESGTTILSSKDLKTIEHLPKILNSGVRALKIEGRNKSEYYLATVAYAYKNALRLANESRLTKERLNKLEDELYKLNNRGYTDGFLFSRAKAGGTTKSRKMVSKWHYLAMIEGVSPSGYLVRVKNKLKVGAVVEILTPSGIYKDKIISIYDSNKRELAEINPGKIDQKAYLKLGGSYPVNSFIRQKTS